MLIEVILPPEIARVLYIDCDTMVNAPIERLAEMDLEGHTIGAARDFIGSEIATQRDMIDARGLFDTGDGYFNSGMMLIDMAGWRRARVIDRLRDAIADGTMKKLYLDQDLLNLIFAGDWLQLDPRWNFTGARPIHEILDPWLLHYVGTHKPWHLKPNLAFARRYRHVMTNELYYRYLSFRWKRRPKSAWREIVDMLLRR
jgi:lipopolysaccharide biosynthesis glycosyltransferase